MPIATGTAIAIAALASGGSAVYSQKSANTTNKRAQALQASEATTAAALQREESTTAATLERERLAETRRAREETIARDKERWQDYLRVHEPFWKAGAGIAGSLFDLAGYGGQAPAYAPPTMPTPGAPSPGGPPTSSTMPVPMAQRTPTPNAAPMAAPSPLRQMPIAELMQMASLMGTAPTAPSANVPVPAYMRGA